MALHMTGTKQVELEQPNDDLSTRKYLLYYSTKCYNNTREISIIMSQTKEEIIHMMCLEYRHDYGLRKSDDSNPLESGLTEKDAKVLYSVMEFIYNELIKLSETRQLKGKSNATKRRKRKS